MIAVKEKAPVYMEVMPSPDKMQSLEFYKLYRDSICAVYGVTPIFVGIIESGKSGNNPRMQIDVQRGTTEEYQRFLEDLWNNHVLPLFGVTDWKIEFGSIEAIDELRQARVWKEKATAAQTLINLGFIVTFDEHGNLEVSLEPEEAAEQPEEPKEEEAKPMEDEVSPDSDESFPKSTPKRELSVYPRPAKKLREELERDLLKIIDSARKVKDVKKSYAQGKKVMDKAHKQLIENARISLSSTLKQELPELPPDAMKKLNKMKNERMREFRKLIRMELKREAE